MARLVPVDDEDEKPTKARAVEVPTEQGRSAGRNIAGAAGKGALAFPGFLGDMAVGILQAPPQIPDTGFMQEFMRERGLRPLSDTPAPQKFDMAPSQALQTLANSAGIPTDYDEKYFPARATDFITSSLLLGGPSRISKAKDLIAQGAPKVRSIAGQLGRETGQAGAAAASSMAVEHGTEDMEDGWLKNSLQFAAPLFPQLGMLGVAGTTRLGFRGADNASFGRRADDFTDATGATPLAHQVAANDRTLMAERGVNFTGIGALPLSRAYETQARAFQNKTASIAGGAERNTAAAGEIIQRGIFGPTGYIENAKGVAKQLYDDYFKALPQDYRFELTNTKKELDDFLNRYGSDPEFKSLLDDPQFIKIRNTIRDNEARVTSQGLGVGPEVGTVRALRTDIGKLMNSHGMGHAEMPTGDLKSLYGALSRDLEQAATSKGGNALKAFKDADSYWKEYRHKTDTFLKPLEGKDVERMYTTIRNGTADQANAVIGSLTKAEKDAFSEVVINRLGLAPKSGQNAVGDVYSPNSFIQNWQTLTPRVKAALIPNQTTRFQLDKMGAAYDDMLRGGKVVFNTSGTTGSGMLGSQIVAFISGLTTAGAGAAVGSSGAMAAGAGLAGTVAATMAVSHWAANRMADPKFVAWLAKSNTVPAVAVPGHISRLARIDFGSEADNAMRDQLVEALSQAYE
jgi:hypothetical protein